MPLADRSRPGVTADRGAQPAAVSPVRALLLGGLHGPAELLPISSSGHVALLPWLLGWGEPGDPEIEKAFEVALHASTALALLIALGGEVGTVLRDLRPRRLALVGLSCLPPALVGLGLERPIERRLGTPPTIAVGLLGGAAAMAWSDRAPQARDEAGANAVDALWLGIAQACALVPGVSRGGATLSAARRRRFTRPDAGRLSRHTALPVIRGGVDPQGVEAEPPGPAGGRRGPVGGWSDGRVPLHTRLGVDRSPGRKRPVPAPVRRLQDGAGGDRPRADSGPPAVRPPSRSTPCLKMAR